MQPTLDGTAEYTCTFDNCMVVWGRLFEFVIQRKTIVQTRHDIHMTFMCIPDINPILSNDAASKNMGDINVTKFIYSAAAEMRFYYNDTELTTGSFIRLGTEVDMVIRITNNFEDFVDINIKACTAATMYMFENRCPVDYELMGEFNKTGIGEVQNKFPMIRPTSTAAGPLDVLFSCTVEVCRTPCEAYVCNRTEPVTMETLRRKRRQTPKRVLKSLMVGTVFRVGMEDILVVEKEIEEDCVAVHIYIIVMTTLGFLILVSMVTLLFYYFEWKSVSKREFKTSFRDSTDPTKSNGIEKAVEPKVEYASGNKPSDRTTELWNKRMNSALTSAPSDLQKSIPYTYKGSCNNNIGVQIESEGKGHHNEILNNSKDTQPQRDNNLIKKKVKTVQFKIENECDSSLACLEPGSDEYATSCMKNEWPALNETTKQVTCVLNTENTPVKLTYALKRQGFSTVSQLNCSLVEISHQVNNLDSRANDGQMLNSSHFNMANVKAEACKATNGIYLEKTLSLDPFDDNKMKTGKETLKVLTQIHNEDKNMEVGEMQSDYQDHCQDDKMDQDHYSSDKVQEKHISSKKSLQKTLAQEALQTTVGRLDPILQKFQSTLSSVRRRSSLQNTDNRLDPILQKFNSTLRSVRRRSSLQKTDSMKSLLSEAGSNKGNYATITTTD